jgi:hypothetical protein
MLVCCHQPWGELSRPSSLKHGTDIHSKTSVTNKYTLATTQKREDLNHIASKVRNLTFLDFCWRSHAQYCWNVDSMKFYISHGTQSLYPWWRKFVSWPWVCMYFVSTYTSPLELSLFVWQFVPFLSCCHLFVHYVLSLPLQKGYKQVLGNLDIIFPTIAVELVCLQCYSFLWHPYFCMKCHAVECDCTLILVCIWHFPFLNAVDEVDRNSSLN